jgi:hypothetical protein
MVGLEDVANVPAAEHVATGFTKPHDIDTRVLCDGESDLTRIGRENPGDQVQQRGFSAAARADHGDLLTVADREVLDVNDRHRRAVGRDVLLTQIDQFHSHACSTLM